MSSRSFLLFAAAGVSLAAAPSAAIAQSYPLPQLEPMPAASQAAPIAQTAQVSQLPQVVQRVAPAAYDTPVPQAPTQDMHPERHHDGNWAGRDHYEEGHHGSPEHLSIRKRPLAYTPEQRAWWISECKRRMSYSYGGYDSHRRGGSNLEGAAIGGVLGGIAGNRIAGRGNRTEGTVIGAVGGAVLGAAIDSATSRSSRHGGGHYGGGDGGYCENYLAAYESGAFGYGHHGYAYAQPMIYRTIGHDGHNCGCTHKKHKHHGKKCKKIVTTKEYWEEVPHKHEVVEKVVEKVRYVKQPTTKTRYVKQPAKTRYVKQPARSVKSVKSRKSK